MARVKQVSRQTLLALTSVFILACTTVEQRAPSIPGEEKVSVSSRPAAPVVYGQGFGATPEEAEAEALRDGARKTAEALLGPGAALKNQEILDRLFSGTALPEAQDFYRENSIEAHSDGDSTGSTGVIRGRLDISVLIDYLLDGGISKELLPEKAEGAGIADETVPGYAEGYFASVSVHEKAEPGPSVQAVQEADALDVDGFERLRLNDDEKERLARYLANLSFMIRTRPSADESGTRARAAALELSRLLGRYGYTCNYPDQVDNILEGQQAAYAEETGGEVPPLQWAAKRLGAGIYAEVDSRIDIRRDAEGFFATASVGVDLVDTWSWEPAASLSSRKSPPAFSAVSEEEAAGIAVRSVLMDLVPEIISSARDSYGKSLARGIVYELVLLNPPDQRKLQQFIGEIESHVRRIRRLSSSAGEVRYELRFLGDVEDLEFLLYSIASGIESFKDFSPAYQRGNELAFYAGLF